ncbi:protein RIC-3b [Kryptolebias marmoratus]|uniref:Protein RIC-3-like n=1 Tax=Kryptolebias marmoratus TaxID=37003 RepID=A0A3Q3ASE5_KRYMA|nr:protein RIC-3b [Kryptolebias marmoratus]
MAMSTFQKVTLATCLVLCVALLLPKMLLSRGRKDAAERPEGSGRFPPMMHRQVGPEGRGQRTAGSGFSRAHNPETIARAKGAGTGAGTGGKSNLAGQIIPVYGFGILLYILYILFKITSKGSSKPSEGRFPPVCSENMKRKITDFELAQLQEKLRETELVMEKIVSSAHHRPDRMKGVTADQEESLLQQLTEITRVMQEGQLVEGIMPEKKPQEDWDEYPEELHPYWEGIHCCCQHSPTGAAQEEGAEKDEDSDGRTGNLPAHAPRAAEANGAGDLGPDAAREPAPATVADAGTIPEGGVACERKEEGGHAEPGFQEEPRAGVLKELELELTLETTSVSERQKVEDSCRPVETETSYSSVRRRNRRRAKKAAH